MNIFFLDECPRKAAAMLCDKHLSKMQLETAQLISTAFLSSVVCNSQMLEEQEVCDVAELAYKATHKQHPSAIWARSSNANLRWLLEHAHGMNDEWLHRKHLRGVSPNKIVSHASYNVSKQLASALLKHCNQVDSYTRRSDAGHYDPELLTEVPLCMPEELYRPGNKLAQSIEEAVPYYRMYYAKHKRSIAKWPAERVPEWWAKWAL